MRKILFYNILLSSLLLCCTEKPGDKYCQVKKTGSYFFDQSPNKPTDKFIKLVTSSDVIAKNTDLCLIEFIEEPIIPPDTPMIFDKPNSQFVKFVWSLSFFSKEANDTVKIFEYSLHDSIFKRAYFTNPEIVDFFGEASRNRYFQVDSSIIFVKINRKKHRELGLKIANELFQKHLQLK